MPQESTNLKLKLYNAITDAKESAIVWFNNIFNYSNSNWVKIDEAYGKINSSYIKDIEASGDKLVITKGDDAKEEIEGAIAKPATKTSLGTVRIGDNISVDTEGSISLKKDGVSGALGYEAAEKMNLVAITIPSTGWSIDDNTSYASYIDIEAVGIKPEDCVALVISPDSNLVAQKCFFAATEAMTDKIRIRARNVPTEAIQAFYYVIREDILMGFGQTPIGGAILPPATKNELGGIIAGDDFTIDSDGVLKLAGGEVDSKLDLSGGTMTGPINFAKSNNAGEIQGRIVGTENDAVNGPGGELNNLVLESWFGLSFTTNSPNQTYTGKTAVGIDCREGIVKAADFQGKWNGMIQRLSHNTNDTWIPVFSNENIDYVLKNEIAGCAYPVGSIYMTVGADPASIFGGTWTLVAGERVLMGAGGRHSAGAYIDAGLPNITGDFYGDLNGNNHQGIFFNGSGALQTNTISWGSNVNAYVVSNSYNNATHINFNAKNSNSIYGKSSTVQPAAYYVNIWQRVS